MSELKSFEDWFTQFKEDNFLCETDWGNPDAKKSIARVCAEAAYIAGQQCTPDPSTQRLGERVIEVSEIAQATHGIMCKCYECNDLVELVDDYQKANN